MFWNKKKRPKPPPATHEEDFVDWLLRYGEEFEIYRKIYSANIEKFVSINKAAVMKELHGYPTHESLNQRYSDGCILYTEGFMSAVEKSGGVRALGLQDPQQQANVVMFQIKLLIFHYILKYKYNDAFIKHSEYLTGKTEELYSKG